MTTEQIFDNFIKQLIHVEKTRELTIENDFHCAKITTATIATGFPIQHYPIVIIENAIGEADVFYSVLNNQMTRITQDRFYENLFSKRARLIVDYLRHKNVKISASTIEEISEILSTSGLSDTKKAEEICDLFAGIHFKSDPQHLADILKLLMRRV